MSCPTNNLLDPPADFRAGQGAPTRHSGYYGEEAQRRPARKDAAQRVSYSWDRTLASLVIANASTVIGFGLLSFSQVPVLVALGTTVAPGAFLALLFGVLLAAPDVSNPGPPHSGASRA